MKFSTFKPLIHLLTLALLLAILLTYVHFLINKNYYQSDFISFFTAAQILRYEPQNLYDLETQQIYQQNLLPDELSKSYPWPVVPFANPPVFLAIFLPFTYLPANVAYFSLMILMGIVFVRIRYFRNGKAAVFVSQPF